MTAATSLVCATPPVPRSWDDVPEDWTLYSVPGSTHYVEARGERALNGVLVVWVIRILDNAGERDKAAETAVCACVRDAVSALIDVAAWLVTNRPAGRRIESVSLSVTVRAVPAFRDAQGFLHCSTPECRTTNEYAEPDPDGSWTCGECRAVRGW